MIQKLKLYLAVIGLLTILPAQLSAELKAKDVPEHIIQSVVQICSDGIGCGSGALLDDGRILTALHVVSEGCWSGYCDSYTVSTAERIGARAKKHLAITELHVEEVFPGLDIAILSGENVPKGLFSLDSIVSLEDAELHTLDFASNRALRFDSGVLSEDRVTYATTTIHGGKGSSGAPVFDKEFRLAGIRVAAASWKDAVRGVAVPYSKGAVTPAAIISKVHQGPIALTIAEGLNAHHRTLRDCPPKKCKQERGFFLGHVVELSHYLGEITTDLNLNRPSWYTIFSFFRANPPLDSLGRELEVLSLAYEIESHIGPIVEPRKSQVLMRLRELIQESSRDELQQKRLLALLVYAEENTWSEGTYSLPEFTDEIVSALALPLLFWSCLLVGLGFFLGRKIKSLPWEEKTI